MIPKLVMQLMQYERPVINGDCSIIQMNELAILMENKNTLNDLVHYLKKYLSEFDKKFTNFL